MYCHIPGARFVIFLLLLFMLITPLFAIRLLTEEKALQEMYPEAESFLSEMRELTPDIKKTVEEKLGGQLVHFQSGSESEQTEEKKTLTCHFAIKNGEKIGVAVIEKQPGKWGPVEFIVSLDIKTAQVHSVAVMSYKEKRGRPIARKNFLKQFFGKSSQDPIKVRKDIRAISGATISSDAACFAVRKVIILYETLYLNQDLS